MGTELAAIADELYGTDPSEFIAARDAKAAEARRAGHRQTAAAIKRLKKPTVAAWLVNLLARQRGPLVGEFLDLGPALRDAQGQLAGGEVRRLSEERRRLTAALWEEARRLADAHAQAVGPGVQAEVEGTLEAALIDPANSDAVRAGCLSGAIRYGGLGSLFDAGGSAGSSAPSPTPPVTKASAKRPARSAAPERQGTRGARQAAARKLQEAAKAASDAERSVESSRLQLARAEATRQQLHRQISDLKARLDRLVAEERQATEEVRQARVLSDTARREARAATADVRRAQSEIDRLDG